MTCSEDFSWDAVYAVWSRTMQEQNVALVPFFQTVAVHNPAHLQPAHWSGRPYQTAMWWEKSQLLNKHADYQEYLLERGMGKGLCPDLDDDINGGSKATIQLLWDVREDHEKVAAALICASIHSRTGSRKHFPEKWPKRRDVQDLLLTAEKRLVKRTPWQTLHTEVLPWTSPDWSYKIDDLHALVRYVAEEHATMLRTYQPVEIKEVNQSEKHILEVIEKRVEQANLAASERSARLADWEKERHEENLKRVADENHKKQQHPRYGEWTRLDDDQLTTLVWTHPFTTIAGLFGVSDTAIKKRCVKNEIPRPDNRFWNKVNANLIPDPKGVVPADVMKLWKS